MATALEIKGIKKYRVAYDESNWIIQQKKKNRKPPNDWENRFYFSTLEGLFPALLKLGVAEEKLSDFKAIVNTYNKKSQLILDAIRTLGEHFDLNPPESTRVKAVKKTITKKKK